MKSSSKSLFLGAFVGGVVCTSLAAMVLDNPPVAPKGDLLMDPVVESPYAVVENTSGNLSIVTRPSL